MKTKTRSRTKAKVVRIKRSGMFNKKALLLTILLLVGSVGAYATLASKAATPIAVGSQFHCTWSAYTDAQRLVVLDKLAAAKIGSVRIDVGWASFQETSRSSYSQWYVNRTDYCVDQARARGLEVMLVLHLTPGWANGGQATSVPPTDLNDFANFAGWLAAHYKGKVIGYEVWNEADPSQSFWTGTSQQYVDMLKLAYPKIKAADPATKVVLAGPAANNLPWLTDIYAKGAKSYFDILATHPYNAVANQPPEAPASDGKWWWFSAFPQIKSLMDQYGDGGKEVWFTEFGWSSHANVAGAPNWQLGVTLQQQGDYLVRAVQYAEANYPNVTRMFWYNERNRTNTDIQNANFGLLNNDLSEKPAYTSLKNYLIGRTVTVDTQAPAVQITSPANSATVSGTITAYANASDNTGVHHVDLLVDNVVKATLTTTPYSYAFNTSQVANGTHSLQFKAYDAAGNVGSSSAISVTVSNPTTPPPAPTPTPTPQPDIIISGLSWSPTTPKVGQGVTFSATIKNQGTAATPAGVVDELAFAVDGTKQTWNDGYTTSLAPGASVTLTASAGLNGNGNWSALSGTHSVEATVDPANRIAETNEGNNKLTKLIGSKDTTRPNKPGKPSATLITQTQVSLELETTSDDTAVTGYTIYRNDLKVADTNEVYYTDSSLQPGTTYAYEVVAYDGAGNVSDRSEVLGVMTTTPSANIGSAKSLPVPENTDKAFAITPSGSKKPITIPGNDQPVVSGKVKIQNPGAKDGITTLILDGKRVMKVSGETVVIDTTTLTNGVHTITLESSDVGGNLSTTSRYIKVVNNINPIENVRNIIFKPVAGKWSGRSMNIVLSTMVVVVAAGMLGGVLIVRRWVLKKSAL